MTSLLRSLRLRGTACVIGVAVCATSMAACDDTFIAIDSSGRIQMRFGDVSWEGDVVTVNNAGADTVFHFMVESEAAALIEWAPCYDADAVACPQIAPGDTAELSYDDIAGYEPGDSLAYFNWWTRVEGVVHSEEMKLR